VIVVVSGVNAPALMFVVPPVSDGLNGRLAPGQGVPCGPVVIANVEELLIVSAVSSHGSADHGTKLAVVV
jgi:hypothetical protein